MLVPERVADTWQKLLSLRYIYSVPGHGTVPSGRVPHVPSRRMTALSGAWISAERCRQRNGAGLPLMIFTDPAKPIILSIQGEYCARGWHAEREHCMAGAAYCLYSEGNSLIEEHIMKNTQNIKKRLHRSQDRMRALCHILAAALFLSVILSPKIPVRADPEDSPTYQVRTRWYERFPDGRHAVIKFPKIVGTGNEEAYANINYILERETFRIAGEFVSDLHQYDNIFQAIAALKNQFYTIAQMALFI